MKRALWSPSRVKSALQCGRKLEGLENRWPRVDHINGVRGGIAHTAIEKWEANERAIPVDTYIVNAWEETLEGVADQLSTDVFDFDPTAFADTLSNLWGVEVEIRADEDDVAERLLGQYKRPRQTKAFAQQTAHLDDVREAAAVERRAISDYVDSIDWPWVHEKSILEQGFDHSLQTARSGAEYLTQLYPEPDIIGAEWDLEATLDNGYRVHGYIDRVEATAGVEVVDYKCVTPDTLVTMADGTRRRADELALGDKVLDGDLNPQRITAIGLQPPETLYRITTRMGRRITVTGEHPFMTLPRGQGHPGGWVDARELQPGTRLQVTDSWDKPDESGLTEDEARFLGMLVGDGSLTGHNVRLTSRDPDVIAWCRRFAEEKQCEVKIYGDTHTMSFISQKRGQHNNQINALMRRVGLSGKDSRSKRVPDDILRGDQRIWAAFLSGYLDADGYVRDTEKTYPLVSYSSVNRALVEDMQELLARLRIVSGISECQTTYNGKPYHYYQLCVRRLEQVHKFAATIEPVIPYKASALANLARRTNSRKGRPPFDEVKAIEVLDATETIGLTVESSHTHFTNGVLTHNSSKYQDTELDHFIQIATYAVIAEDQLGFAPDRVRLAYLRDQDSDVYEVSPGWRKSLESLVAAADHVLEREAFAPTFAGCGICGFFPICQAEFALTPASPSTKEEVA